jgi:hypothetical protein
VRQFFLATNPAYRAHEASAHDDRKTVIEPYDCRCSRPDNIPYSTVVPIRYPAISRQGHAYPVSKDVSRIRSPVRSPVQRVKVDMRQAEVLLQSLCQFGLAGAGATHYSDTAISVYIHLTENIVHRPDCPSGNSPQAPTPSPEPDRLAATINR